MSEYKFQIERVKRYITNNNSKDSISFLRRIGLEKMRYDFFKDILSDKYVICNITLKVLSYMMDTLYSKGNEMSIRQIIKDTINCIPLGIFRYLILNISDRTKKVRIFKYALDAGRFDLVPSIKGLRSEDYAKIYNDYSQTDNNEIKTMVKSLYSNSVRNEREKNKSAERSKRDSFSRAKRRYNSKGSRFKLS